MTVVRNRSVVTSVSVQTSTVFRGIYGFSVNVTMPLEKLDRLSLGECKRAIGNGDDYEYQNRNQHWLRFHALSFYYHPIVTLPAAHRILGPTDWCQTFECSPENSRLRTERKIERIGRKILDFCGQCVIL
jgi:hypothetical protein